MTRTQTSLLLSLAFGLAASPALEAADGTWTSLSSGNWNNSANWSGGGIANGIDSTAYFSTLDITNGVTVTLDINPTLGGLQFGDTVASADWTLTGGSLSLQTSAGTPNVAVTNRTATINSGLSGSQGFNKTGAGTLALGVANSFSGGTLSNLAGTISLTNTAALNGLAGAVVASGAQLKAAASGTFSSLPITISGSGGNGALYFNRDGATLNWPGAITLNGSSQIASFSAGQANNLQGSIGGTGPLTFWAGGAAVTHVHTFILGSACTYSGATTLITYSADNVVKLAGGTNTLPTTTDLTMTPNFNSLAVFTTLDLNGNNQQLNTVKINGSAQGIGNLTSSSGKPTLTISSGNNGAFQVASGLANISGINVNVPSGVSGADYVTVFGYGGAATVNITNCTFNSSTLADVGRSASAVVNINNGGVFNNTGEILIGYGNSSGVGTLTVNSGGLVNAHFVRLGQTASGTVNLNTNGTIIADRIYARNANLFNFNGGLLQVNNGFVTPWFESSVTNVYVQPGGAFINTAGHDATCAANLLSTNGNGGLTKLGAGALILTATNHTYVGNTVISNGTLAVDGVLASSPVLVVSPAVGAVTALAGTGAVATVTVSSGSSVYPGRAGTAGTLAITNLTCNAGAWLRFDLADPAQVGSGVNDLLNLQNLTVASPTYVSPDFPSGTPVAGRYVVATYTSASGLPNLAVDPIWVGSRAQVSLDTSVLGQIALVVGSSAGPNSALTWYGNNPNNNWDLSGVLNWASGGDAFYNGDGVIFDDSGLTNTVNLGGAMLPAAVTFNNSMAPYTLTGSGKITGAAGLTLNGSGAVIVATDNDYTGTNVINGTGATLQVGNGGTHGAIGSGDVLFASTATGATLAYNRADALTLNNRIAGGSAYQPAVVVNSGSLTLGGTADNAWTTATVNSNATLVLAKASSTNVHAVGGASASLTVNAGGTAKLGGSGGDQIADSRDVQLSGGTFDLAGMSEKINNLVGYGVLSNSGTAATLTCGATLNVTGGKLILAGGTLNPTGGTVPNVAVRTNSVLELVGGTLNSSGYIGVGGQLNVLGGQVYSGLEIMPGFSAVGAPGTVNLAGGSASCVQYRVSDGFSGTTYLQTNGVLYTAEVKQQASTPGWLYFNGGTLSRGSWGARNNGIWVHDVANVLVQQGGAFIDVSNYVVNIPLAIAHDPALLTADGGLNKLGTGTLALSGTNTYTGPTTVSYGKLSLTNNGSLATSSSILVAAGATFDVSQVTGGFGLVSGQTLGGNGTVVGPVTVQSGALLAPGTSAIGTLTVNSDLSLAGNLLFKLDKSQGQSNDLVVVSGALANTGSGTLLLTNLGPALVAGDTFKLFNQPLVGGSALTISSSATGVVWTNNLAVDGTIAVVSVPGTVNTTPAPINSTYANKTLTLAWPADHLGWIVQSNSVGVNKTNWYDVPGSDTVTNMSFSLDPSKTNVFFRMRYPVAP